MADETMMTGELNTDPAEGNQAEGEPTDGVTQPEGGEPTAAPEQGNQEGEGENDGEQETQVPETYEWSAPEGFEGELDQAAIEQFEPMAKELGLSQEQANKLVAMHAESIQRANASAHENWAQQQKTWRDDLQNDPDFGGKAFNENVQSAMKAVDQFGSPGLKEALEQTGMGNHPEFVRTFAAIGKAISEDKIVMGNQSHGERAIEDRMYPNMKS